jgi:hypothetical protein
MITNIKKLNEVYRSILGRSVDSSGMSSYAKYMDSEDGINFVKQQLLTSAEYRKSKSSSDDEFNSLAGDRVSYISSESTNEIDSSQYASILDYLIKSILLIDYPYSEDQIKDRAQTVKKSLIHINKSNLRFTIFPHRENVFNTEYFIDSLREYSHMKYYITYMCIINIWKTIFNKTVDTCQTKVFIDRLNNLDKNTLSFNDILNCVGEFFIDYLSIKMIGQTLNQAEKHNLVSLLKEEKANDIIEYLEKLNISYREIENTKIQNTINSLTLNLGRKPKVLVMIAYLETQNDYFLEKMMYHINKVKSLNSNLDIDFALDNERIGKESSDYTPWSRVKRIRNLMINKYSIRDYDYLYIIDSDMIDYPHDFVSRAIGLNPDGITAPLALIQNSTTFYDWCGYQRKGATSLNSQYADYILMLNVKERNFNLLPPYVDDDARLVEIDCVGCTYVVPSKVFDLTYGDLQQELLKVFDIANVTNHKISENKVQYEDHPSFTDHYTICAATRANGGKIYMDRGSAAYHADLPIFGEKWH